MTWRRHILALPAALLTLAGVVAPILILLRVSLYAGGGASGFGLGGAFYEPGTWSLAAWTWLLTEDYPREIFNFTLKTVLICTLSTLALAIPLARWIASLPPRLGGALLGLTLLPKFASTLVLVFGLKLLLSAASPVADLLTLLALYDEPRALDGPLSVWIAECFMLLPYPVLLLTTAYRAIPADLTDAARGLGASPLRTFVAVVLPLTWRSTLLAALLTATWAFGTFVAPYLLGGPDEFTLAVDIHRQAFENLNWPRAAAAAVAMTLAAAALAALATLARRRLEAPR